MISRKNVLIDCDPGIDDALALLLALSSDDLNVEGLTTVYGNVGVDRSTENLINILGLTGLRYSPRIGKGAARPLIAERLGERLVHGKDGLGNTDLVTCREGVEIEDACELAVSLIEGGRIDYIIATGPLTNIANIIKKCPDISKKLKGIYLMGGAIAVEGNITPYAEFNIYNDPEAASSVFESDLPKTVVSLDVTRDVTLNDQDLHALSETRNKLSKFICDIVSYSIDYNRRFRGLPGASLHDPLCVGVAADEGISTYKEGRFGIELNGRERGRIKEGENIVRYCVQVNVERFKELLLTGLTRMIKEM